ncbi:ATP-dependent DNA helicase RRM3-like [Aphis craccivora]|uniref:ATP-dependent DNA helicase RRM3-like n=1 Tax=Aphis craccivora TaxID=307492 RepID=A0A6G0YW28_APHCR|nr:ATP-dependent DNA helicase RRM3-like [Aphis craccivora]
MVVECELVVAGKLFLEPRLQSKGQSLIMAEIGLREECFSHGQFYVTCFRVSSASSLIVDRQCSQNMLLIVRTVILEIHLSH